MTPEANPIDDGDNTEQQSYHLPDKWIQAIREEKFHTLISNITTDFSKATDSAAEEEVCLRYIADFHDLAERTVAAAVMLVALIESCAKYRPTSLSSVTFADIKAVADPSNGGGEDNVKKVDDGDVLAESNAALMVTKKTTPGAARKYRSLAYITRVWGANIVSHYRWGDASVRFCDTASRAARNIGSWDRVTGYLNQLLFDQVGDWGVWRVNGVDRVQTKHFEEVLKRRRGGDDRCLSPELCRAMELVLDLCGLIDVHVSEVPVAKIGGPDASGAADGVMGLRMQVSTTQLRAVDETIHNGVTSGLWNSDSAKACTKATAETSGIAASESIEQPWCITPKPAIATAGDLEKRVQASANSNKADNALVSAKEISSTIASAANQVAGNSTSTNPSQQANTPTKKRRHVSPSERAYKQSRPRVTLAPTIDAASAADDARWTRVKAAAARSPVDSRVHGESIVKDWDGKIGRLMDCLRDEMKGAKRPPDGARGAPTIRDRGFDMAIDMLDRATGAGWAVPWIPLFSNDPWAVEDDTRDSADVWIVTKEELTEMFKRGIKITKPVLGKGWVEKGERPTIQDYTAELAEMVGNDYVEHQNVQACVEDFGSSDAVTKRLSAYDIQHIFSVKEKGPLSNDTFPVNCLNLRQTMDLGAPAFTRRTNFNLLRVLDNRNARRDGQGGIGKRLQQRPRDTDAVNCSSFMLLAQRGSTSGWHIDILTATWVACLGGLKLWPILTSATNLMEEFGKKGASWRPPTEQIAMIPISAGDVLYMPAGELVPHAPITLEDTLMYGGMVLDSDRIVDQLANTTTIMRLALTSNEVIQMQWPSLVDELKLYAAEPNSRFSNDQQLVHRIAAECDRARRELACACWECVSVCRSDCDAFPEGDRDCSCPCVERLSRCTTWCHGKRRRARYCMV